MGLFDISAYDANIINTPRDKWRGKANAGLKKLWQNHTNVFEIYEQDADEGEFEDSYTKIEVLIDSISETLVNANKVYSDFISITFDSNDHKQNYRGQFYQIDLDKTREDDPVYDTYLCYDKINPLSTIAKSKLVRCNNVLKWIDDRKIIREIPCYLGSDISSTNNQTSKEGTIPQSRMVILTQANDYTLEIRENQRFMFNHKNCFKVEEINSYMTESGGVEGVTWLKIYVAYSPLTARDNRESNICEYDENADYPTPTLKVMPTVSEMYKGDVATFTGDFDEIIVDPACMATKYELIDNNKIKCLGYDMYELDVTFVKDGETIDEMHIKLKGLI